MEDAERDHGVNGKPPFDEQEQSKAEDTEHDETNDSSRTPWKCLAAILKPKEKHECATDH